MPIGESEKDYPKSGTRPSIHIAPARLKRVRATGTDLSHASMEKIFAFDSRGGDTLSGNEIDDVTRGLRADAPVGSGNSPPLYSRDGRA
ncbi:unnamed protein product, partial [Iphiclides podalirius]